MQKPGGRTVPEISLVLIRRWKPRQEPHCRGLLSAVTTPRSSRSSKEHDVCETHL